MDGRSAPGADDHLGVTLPLRPRVRMSALVCLLGAVTLTACSSAQTTAPPSTSPAAAGSSAATGSSTSADTLSATPGTSTAQSAAEASSAEESSTEESSTEEATGGAPATGGAGAPGDSGSESDCPIGSSDLAAITGVSWQFVIAQIDHPSEVYDGVLTDVCGFTAPEVVDEYGDPAFVRIDVYSGADVSTRQEGYVSTCTSIGGTVTTGPASGGVYCTKDGVAVDGQVGRGDRLVEVWINSGGDATAQLSAVFDQILAAVN